MKIDKTFEALKLDFNSAEPLYQQLHRQLEQYLKEKPGGFKIPSERKFSELLGIDRNTVRNALKLFLESGKLVKLGNRGTFVAGGEISPNPEHTFRNLLFDESAAAHISDHCRRLKILLYEDGPIQKEFWEKAIGLFQKYDPDLKLEVIWLPHDVDIHGFKDYVYSQMPDIIQTYLSGARNDILQELPDCFNDAIYQDSADFDYLFGHQDALYERFVPVYYCPMLHFLNLELAREYGLDEYVDQFRLHGVSAVLDKAMTSGAPNIDANLYWDWQMSEGIPSAMDFSSILNMLEMIFKNSRRYLPQFSDSAYLTFEGTRDQFFNNERLLLCCYANRMNATVDELRKKTAISFHAPGTRISHSGLSCLGMFRESAAKASSLRFLNFISSREVQEMVPSQLLAFAFHRRHNQVLVRDGDIADSAMLLKSEARVRSFYHAEPDSLFLPNQAQFRHLYFAFVQGDLSYHQALEQLREEFDAFREKFVDKVLFDNWKIWLENRSRRNFKNYA